MHIPDGFLDAKTWISLSAVSAAGISVALKKIRSDEDYSSKIPMIGMVSAFIFATQMINFPIAGATSGHLGGATLAAVLFGPWVSLLIMTTVVAIQALFFQDGGITALGANIFNMGFVSALTGYAIYSFFRYSSSKTVRAIGIFVASWVSVMAAAVAVAIELAVSGTVPLSTAMKAMITWHSLIGIGEGIISTGVVLFLIERKSAAKYLLDQRRV